MVIELDSIFYLSRDAEAHGREGDGVRTYE
jgi:hypothetical protein